MDYIYLSRKNLNTLLSKLDRKASGDYTFCAIIKSDTEHPTFPQTIEKVMVTAVEDRDYYIDRPAGDVVFEDNNYQPREDEVARILSDNQLRELLMNINESTMDWIRISGGESSYRLLNNIVTIKGVLDECKARGITRTGNTFFEKG